MPRNYELDSLKSREQDAFQRKQAVFQRYKEARDHASDIHNKMESAWQERSSAREEMNREYEKMQRNSEHYREVWDEYGRIRDGNNPRIESLKWEADREHQEMISCFDQASSEYEYGDKSMAPIYSQEGHEHKERRDELNAEISELAREIKEARQNAEWRAPKTDSFAFHRAKEAFERAKSRHESIQAEFKHAKAERDRLKAEFDSLHEEHLRLKEEFQRKLEAVKSANKRERNRTLDKANISWSERSTAKIVKKADGTVQIYHGGIGAGDGYGHGHTVLDQFGNKTYDRDAFKVHGSQNYTDSSLRNGTYRGTFDGQPAVIKVSDSGNSDQIQIFYGGKGSPDGPGHNHVNYIKGKLQFWREHGKTLYQDDKKNQINNL